MEMGDRIFAYMFQGAAVNVKNLPHKAGLYSHDFFQRPAFGKLVYEFVQTSYLPHKRVFNFLNTHAAYVTCDQAAVGIERRGIQEKIAVSHAGFFDFCYIFSSISCKP